MFKVDNKNTRTTSRRSGVFIVNFEHIFDHFSSVPIVDFEQVNVYWINQNKISLLSLDKYLILITLVTLCNNHRARLLLKPGPGHWTRTLDPEKPVINIGLKNMSDFRELCFIKTMRIVIYCLKVRVLTDI